MPRLSLEGGHVLNGTVRVSGAKNAALPILAGTILVEGDSLIENVPNLLDISTMTKMLNALDVVAEPSPEKNILKIRNNRKIRHIAPYDLVTAMRASFFVAGPILARTGYAKVPMPGGCSIGSRPIDIHLTGFKAMGAEIRIEHGFVELKCPKLKGTRMHLDFPSVGATENIMMAATLAQGQTIIENAAREPEIDDLANYLNNAGAQISGIGTSVLTINGVPRLTGCTHRVIADRIEAATLLIAGAITGGKVTVEDAIFAHLEPIVQKMQECGVLMDVDVQGNKITVSPSGPLKAVNFETMPFPGFPTDAQAQMMTLLTISAGTSVVAEKIFENRFMHAEELKRLGANIKTHGDTAIITGVPRLSGAEVKITDLRAGAALILAGLNAEGITTVHGLKHLKRGYENLPEKLTSLGAKIL
jgi:UDP-N-acetylglucosamine 1-carboxyvinyltransferase